MKRREIGLSTACLLAALLLILLCSQSSPLYPTNTWADANCLLTVGRVMKSGGVLYRDVYEQKGPTLYLIHAVAAWICDASFFGVFVMEVLSLFGALRLSCALLTRRVGSCTAVCVSALVGAALLTGNAFMHGDSAEEFCLPFLLGALVVVQRTYGVRKGPMAVRWLFVCGLLAGMVATIKFTMLGLFVGLCAAEGTLALRAGGVRRALQSAGVFLAGMMLPVAVWCAYFAMHGALGDFYTAYVHNNVFLYSDETRVAMDLLRDMYRAARDNLLWVLIACAGGFALLADRKEPIQFRLSVLTMACGASASVFLLGRVFPYYPLALGAFAFMGAYGLLGAFLPRVRLAGGRKAALRCIAVLIAAAIACSLSPNAPMRGIKRKKLAQTRLAKYIEPGATLLQYSHLDDGLYLFSGTLPTERYFCRLNVNVEEMYSELDRYVEEAIPDYVLVSWSELPTEFDRYQWVATDAGYDDQRRINKLLHLYRRK